MKPIIEKITNPNTTTLFNGEWLLTNGLGGFSCGTLCGAPTRKYHSLLTAALPAPFGRTIMLNYVEDILVLNDNRQIPLSLIRTTQTDEFPSFSLIEFRLEDGLPIWRYQFEDIILEKSLLLIHKQNTTHISYQLISAGQPLQLKWRPYLHFRTNEDSVDSPSGQGTYDVHAHGVQYEIVHPSFPPLRMYNYGEHTFTLDTHTHSNVHYEIEMQRGYQYEGNLLSPGYFFTPLQQNEKQTFIASTESWQTIYALNPHEASVTERQRRKNIKKTAKNLISIPLAAKLVIAADQFIMTPSTRMEDMVRLQAAGEEARSIIAGYPWFTDWGRDTMISLEGLTLTTGQTRTAHAILHTFAYYVKDGLIPNMFPDGEKKGLYHTADASLWFFHAIDRYLELTHDEDILEIVLPKLNQIINSHMAGTLFGIKMDEDGLLIQGQKDFQLTWMDAKVGDWVVTPRRGKAVEINALWYNALKLWESWTGKNLEITRKCQENFNAKFWYPEGNYLYDVIEGETGNDAALRPNQLLAISLKYPILDPSKWGQVIALVEKELLTPLGLRTLSPKHPDYRPTYDGDLRARDAAYHQGTVWPWLIGPFIDAWLKVYPHEKDKAQTFLKGLEEHLTSNCMGTIGEIFDATPPYHARGCFAQAWSVAEILRCIVKTQT